jgi:protoporphyrin/coproporphyrin ferrochelatase
MTAERPAVLLMAYGSPDSVEQVAPYFTHIRGGRPPSAEAIANLEARYRFVGGRTPLLTVTRAVRSALEQQLGGDGAPRVFIGMKHWHPFIADTIGDMARAGITSATAIALAPHYSRMSIGGYRRAVDEALGAIGLPFPVTFVSSWHRQAEFVAMMADLVQGALRAFPKDDQHPVTTVFTAHSLPEKIREWNDPYERELAESAANVAQQAGLRDWRVAWQSAGGTGEPWIGPDILDCLSTLAGEGVRRVLQVPIGFVAEHLEILYDIDIEAQQEATRLGLTLARTAMPNASPAFIRTLAAVVRDAASLASVPVG